MLALRVRRDGTIVCLMQETFLIHVSIQREIRSTLLYNISAREMFFDVRHPLGPATATAKGLVAENANALFGWRMAVPVRKTM